SRCRPSVAASTELPRRDRSGAHLLTRRRALPLPPPSSRTSVHSFRAKFSAPFIHFAQTRGACVWGAYVRACAPTDSLLPSTTMQAYPSPAMQTYPQPTVSYPAHRAPRGPLRPAIKPYVPGRSTSYPPAYSTRTVWGGSTAPESDSDSNDTDSDTVTGTVQTSTSIASSRSRAPGNAPAQQRRVAHWVHDTQHHAPEFKSPFASARSTTQHHHHHRESERREPLPVWVPRPQQLQHTVSQPGMGMPMQPYALPAPQMAWGPAPPQPPGNFGMGMGANVHFAPPPSSVTIVKAPHKHKRSKTEDKKAHGGGKRRH
ncbi:hypothetical protein FB451DRAFT_452962, partial [Mycena latifolia]